jgi:hypothetical protein
VFYSNKDKKKLQKLKRELEARMGSDSSGSASVNAILSASDGARGGSSDGTSDDTARVVKKQRVRTASGSSRSASDNDSHGESNTTVKAADSARGVTISHDVPDDHEEKQESQQVQPPMRHSDRPIPQINYEDNTSELVCQDTPWTAKRKQRGFCYVCKQSLLEPVDKLGRRIPEGDGNMCSACQDAVNVQLDSIRLDPDQLAYIQWRTLRFDVHRWAGRARAEHEAATTTTIQTLIGSEVPEGNGEPSDLPGEMFATHQEGASGSLESILEGEPPGPSTNTFATHHAGPSGSSGFESQGESSGPSTNTFATNHAGPSGSSGFEPQGESSGPSRTASTPPTELEDSGTDIRTRASTQRSGIEEHIYRTMRQGGDFWDDDSCGAGADSTTDLLPHPTPYLENTAPIENAFGSMDDVMEALQEIRPEEVQEEQSDGIIVLGESAVAQHSADEAARLARERPQQFPRLSAAYVEDDDPTYGMATS